MRTASLLAATAIALAACGHHRRGAPCSAPRDTYATVVRVDDASDFMQRAADHVGIARDGAATDPAAIAAGVRVEVDQWRPHGGPSITDYMFVASTKAAIERYVASLAPALEVPPDHRLVYEHAVDHWRSFYVDAHPILDDTAFARGELDGDSARLELTEAGAAAFADATAKAVGHKLAVVVDVTAPPFGGRARVPTVDGEVVSAPIVRSPIRGGEIEIATPAKADAAALLHRIGCSGA